MRSTVYILLALLVAAGGWVRFNDRIAEVSPVLAAPAAPASQAIAAAHQIKGLVELGMVPSSETGAAVSAMKLPAPEAASLTRALDEDRVRLVRLPLFDTGLSTPGGRLVQVSTAGFTQVIRLSDAPLAVVLPINRVGEVSFRMLGGSADPAAPAGETRLAAIGALTLSGPVHLPDLHAGDQLTVGVVAQ
ncbi:hypothetical protein [Rhizosaccharibacter radicis]|uniref:SAF domain-containing protein n=1 Tax=Rhizosaccharibacter radicis TaxID=2782605 RepID=A0ABT1VZ25_9PROT|nr:hypothetical protein [Acetobacteraceae bacterium KSS12]